MSRDTHSSISIYHRGTFQIPHIQYWILHTPYILIYSYWCLLHTATGDCILILHKVVLVSTCAYLQVGGCQNLTHSPCPRLLSRVVPRTRCKLKLGCHLAPLPVERVQHKRTRLLAELRRQVSIERRLNARARDKCQSQIQSEAQSQCLSHGSASLPRHSVSPTAQRLSHDTASLPKRLSHNTQSVRWPAYEFLLG